MKQEENKKAACAVECFPRMTSKAARLGRPAWRVVCVSSCPPGMGAALPDTCATGVRGRGREQEREGGRGKGEGDEKVREAAGGGEGKREMLWPHPKPGPAHPTLNTEMEGQGQTHSADLLGLQNVLP